MRFLPLATLSGAALLLAGCGGGEGGDLTAEENRRLDNAAEMLDTQVFDTSPDSLVAEEEAAPGDVMVVGNAVTDEAR